MQPFDSSVVIDGCGWNEMVSCVDSLRHWLDIDRYRLG